MVDNFRVLLDYYFVLLDSHGKRKKSKHKSERQRDEVWYQDTVCKTGNVDKIKRFLIALSV